MRSPTLREFAAQPERRRLEYLAALAEAGLRDEFRALLPLLSPRATRRTPPTEFRSFPKYQAYMRRARRDYCQMLKERAATMSRRAEIAGVNRTDLYRLFDRHGVER